MSRHRYAFLHGFASSSESRKGVALARAFGARGVHVEVPDLNRPSFAELRWSAVLEAIDRMDAQAPDATWRFIGSSMGGYLTARWAELHPARVDRVVLLCPAFDMPHRWPTILGAEALERWRREGTIEVRDAKGVPTPLHFGLYEEACTHPPFPDVRCPALILHGTRDTTVPIALSRSYAASHPNVKLIELDDDHELIDNLPRVEREAAAFFGVG